MFHADWSTAQGITQAALLDNSKTLPFDNAPTNGAVNGGEVLRVVSASGLGFPSGMANVLRVTRGSINNSGFCKIGTDASGTSVVPKWAQLNVGEAFFGRVYLRVDIPDSEGDFDSGTGSHHPIQVPHDIGNFEPTTFYSRSNGTFSILFYTFAQESQTSGEWTNAILGTFVDNTTYGSKLPKATVLRFEWMVRRDTSSGYSIAIRVYDATTEASGGAGSLMWSEDGVGASQGTVMSNIGSSQHTMKSHDGLYVANLTHLQSFAIGENGGQHAYSQDVYFYYGGLAFWQGAVATTTWGGKYAGGV